MKPLNTESQALVKAAPKLISGEDARVGKSLSKRFDRAQRGMVDILSLGIEACEVKDLKLKHGQFGPWLAAHAPKLCRANSVTGSLQPSHALESYMAMTRAVLEAKKLTVKEYCTMISNTPCGVLCLEGKLLTLPEKKVPEPLRPLRMDLIESVKGKTQRQVMMDFNQVEDDGDGIKKKHGRLKGQGGKRALTTAEQLDQRRGAAEEHDEDIHQSFKALGPEFVLLDDEANMATIAELDRQAKARKAWLKKHDAEAIEELLK